MRRKTINKIKPIIIVLVLIIMFFILCSKVNRIVVRKGCIVKVDNQTLTIWDDVGNEWQYITNKDFKVNDRIKIVFDNNNTIDTVEDDIITKIKKIK